MQVRLKAWRSRATGWLPTGSRLSDARWPDHHRAMLWALWLHLPPLAVVGLATRESPDHVAVSVGLLLLGALGASTAVLGRRVRTLLAVVTLVSCSAVLVHFTHGLTESHFHFFAVIAFIALYQEWMPFAVAFVYVIVHHGVVGVLFPTVVYGHAAAWERPVLWAFIHGGYIVLASLAALAAWRLSEVERENAERVLAAAGDGIYGVDERGRLTFANAALCEMVGKDRNVLEGADHHDILEHRLPDGSAVGRAECPLCVAARRPDRGSGEACLGTSGPCAPVSYVTSPAKKVGGDLGSVITLRDLREFRAMEAQRRQAEAERDQLASVAQATPDLAVIGRPDGRVTWMNSAGRSVLGFRATDDLGAYRIEDFFSAVEMARVYADVMPALVRDVNWQGEWAMQARDGTQIPTAVTMHLHRDAQGETAYVSGIMRDLRAQRAEERARAEGEQRLAAAETVAGMGSWHWDPVSDEIMWSPGMYRLHGQEPGSGRARFQDWLATVHPDDRQWAEEQARQALTGENGMDFVYRGLRADGSSLVIHGRGELVRDEAEGRVSVLGTLLDITDRHAASEALRESEERARRVIATAGDAYLQFQSDGLVTEWNDQAETMFGLGRDEALGRPLASLVLAPEHREQFARGVGLGKDLGPGPSAGGRFELPLIHRSGREVLAEVTAWTVTTGGGEVYSCLVRDIGERQALERAKNEFISVVGHELRTPLTSIHGALGLLRAGLLGELTTRGQHMADIAAHNTDRLVRLINDILDIERLNSGKVALERRDCDIAELAGRSVEAMRPMAETAGVRLLVDAQSGCVRIDPDRIEQTLTNLLSNAIKFSPAGSSVRLLTRTDGDDVEIQVCDRGRGIPPGQLEAVFDRFQQIDGSDAREKGGTGLGLTICRTIVEQHGGRIWADHGPGGGTTLMVRLPISGRSGKRHGDEDPTALDLLERPATGTAGFTHA